MTVSGEPWGAVGASFADGRVPDGLDERLARFADLVSLAISNAQTLEELARQATTDAVTGLANHRRFHERLHEEIERALRYDHPLTLAVIDIDHFKRVNDTHGHQTGDRVLAEVAHQLGRAGAHRRRGRPGRRRGVRVADARHRRGRRARRRGSRPRRDLGAQIGGCRLGHGVRRHLRIRRTTSTLKR